MAAGLRPYPLGELKRSPDSLAVLGGGMGGRGKEGRVERGGSGWRQGRGVGGRRRKGGMEGKRKGERDGKGSGPLAPLNPKLKLHPCMMYMYIGSSQSHMSHRKLG